MIGAHPAIAALVASGLRSDRFVVIELTESGPPARIQSGNTTVLWGSPPASATVLDRLIALLDGCPPGSRCAVVNLEWPGVDRSGGSPHLLVRGDAIAAIDTLRTLLQSGETTNDRPRSALVALVVEAHQDRALPDASQLDVLAGDPAYAQMRTADAAKALSKLLGVPRALAYEAVTRARDADDSPNR